MINEQQARGELFLKGLDRLSKQLGFQVTAGFESVRDSIFIRPVIHIKPDPNWTPPKSPELDTPKELANESENYIPESTPQDIA